MNTLIGTLTSTVLAIATVYNAVAERKEKNYMKNYEEMKSEVEREDYDMDILEKQVEVRMLHLVLDMIRVAKQEDKTIDDLEKQVCELITRY